MDLLTLLWLVPMIGMALVLLAPRTVGRVVSLAATVATLVISDIIVQGKNINNKKEEKKKG